MLNATPPQQNKSALREIAETLLITLIVYIVVRVFLFENYRVVGSSMEPTLQDSQFLVVNKLGYRLYKPQRGDIIVFRDPNAENRKLIKRVIGLPSEVVEIRNGRVFIDGTRLDESYIGSMQVNSRGSTPVPDDEYYVLGDNRQNSSDSRVWGTLPRDAIVGKAWLTYWPPDLWGTISHQAYGEVP